MSIEDLSRAQLILELHSAHLMISTQASSIKHLRDVLIATKKSLELVADQYEKESKMLIRCIEDIAIIGADYDGYDTIDGLKSCIDRLVAIAQDMRPEPRVDNEGNAVEE